MTPFLSLLGKGDAASFAAAAAFDQLLAALTDREGPHHRGWDRRCAIGPDGAVRETISFPSLWLARLDRAAEAGLFARKTADEIATRILTTEPPADLIGEGT
jgi:hypothetical protein